MNKYKFGDSPFDIPQQSAEVINNALDHNKKVCAVDISTLQTLESAISSQGRLLPKKGWTNTFVRPPYEPVIPNALLVNFYLPKSIPFVSTASFAGHKLLTEKVYPTAIKEGYRFFVYGDALLIL